MKRFPCVISLLAGFLGGGLFTLLNQTLQLQPRRTTVEAQEFRLVDSDGVVRGWFRVKGANAALSITGDSSGQSRALIGVDQSGLPVISLSEPGGPRLLLSVKDGGGCVNLYNQAGRSASFGPDVLNLRDSSGRVRLGAAILPDETPLLGFYDEHGRFQTVLAASAPR